MSNNFYFKGKARLGPGHSLLLRRLIILFALLTIAVVGILAKKHFTTTKNISASVIKQITEQAEHRIISFFRPTGLNTELLKKWGQGDILDISAPSTLHAKLIPVLDSLPQINSIVIATDNALEYVLVREDNAWLTRFAKTTKRGERHPVWHRLNQAGETVEEWKDVKTPASQDFAWFQGAKDMQGDELYWTEPYILFPGSEIVITNANSWKKEGILYVAAANILMRDVVQLLDAIKISESSRVFLYADNKVIIDFQQTDIAAIASAQDAKPLLDAKISQDPVITDAMQTWGNRDNQQEPFRFISNHIAWWGLLVGIEDSDNDVGIGMLIPEKDLIAQQEREKYLFVLIALGIFWIGLLLYARSYFRHEQELATQPNLVHSSEDDILGAIKKGEHDKLEFKSTLRWNLKADKPGKEVELASLKTIAAFMNSNGGNLLVGVEDNGNILGVEADNFANEDKYLLHFSNIFNQHIGLEFAEYIEFAIKLLGDKKIFVIACRKSSKPVFLKHKTEESFFIRSGASSRQLTPSQLLNYLKK